MMAITTSRSRYWRLSFSPHDQTVAVRLGCITHRQQFVELLQVTFLYLVAHLIGADIFVLQAEAVLLVFFGNLLRHLSLFHSSQFGKLVMLAVSYSIGKELHRPDVIFGRLAGRELDFLRSLLGRYRANLQILAEDGAHRREKHLRVDASCAMRSLFRLK